MRFALGINRRVLLCDFGWRKRGLVEYEENVGRAAAANQWEIGQKVIDDPKATGVYIRALLLRKS